MSTASNPPAASAPASTGAIPPATTYTEAQFTEAVERARTEERSKIATELEAARKEVTTLTEKLASQTTELSTLRNTAETLQKSVKTDGKIDVSKLIEEVSDRVARTASSAAASKMAELETRVATLSQELKAKQLSEFRAKAISDAGGVDALIPELVRGNTEEEITASVTESKTIFDKTKAKFAPTTAPVLPGNEAKPGATTPAAPAAGATAPVAAAPAAATVPPVPEASPEQNPTGIRPVTTTPRVPPGEWKNRRQEAMRALEGRYAAPTSV
jgi:Skp family chaperone for outer membrane proteins